MNRPPVTKDKLTPWPPTKGMIKAMGKKYGRLVILGSAGRCNKYGSYYFECLCDCGGIAIVEINKLKSGHTSSCGCLHKERLLVAVTKHGESGWGNKKGAKYVVYKKWQSVKSRCLYKSTPGYVNYGAKGITICDGYRYNYELFKADLGIQPTSEHSVDRINPKLSYSCGKCEHCKKHNWPMNIRWADKEMQANNKKNSVFIEYNGCRMTTAQASRKYNISGGVLRDRIRGGWSVAEAINTPVTRRVCVAKLMGNGSVMSMYKSITEAAVKNGLTTSRICSAIKNNYRAGGHKWKYL